MKKVLLMLILQTIVSSTIFSQSFTIKDLLNLAYLPTQDIDHVMKKRGYELIYVKTDSISSEAEFAKSVLTNSADGSPKEYVNITLENDCRNFVLKTASLSEFVNGQRSLIKSGFYFDERRDVNKDSTLLFQKGNIVILAAPIKTGDETQYTFELKLKKIPSGIKYAEDLLQFDSHELLASFFGNEHVTKDMYYFSEKELKPCSVLFSGTRFQVVFVWGDEVNLNKLLFILVPHALPTKGGSDYNPIIGDNEWQFRNGIYPGMNIKELLRLNGRDFNIYGNASDLAFMVKPGEKGNIDFKKTSIMLSCTGCGDIRMFNQKEVSALNVISKEVPMYINDVILYPNR